MDHIGRRLRERRLHYGFTQKDIQTLTGVNKDFVCKIEKGRAEASMETLYKLCIGLGLEWHELLPPIDSFWGLANDT